MNLAVNTTSVRDHLDQVRVTQRADSNVTDTPVWLYHYRHRQRSHIIRRRRLCGREHDRVRDAQTSRRALNLIGTARVHCDSHQRDFGVRRLQLVQLRNLSTAGPTPARPEIENHCSIPILVERDHRSCWTHEFQIGCLRGDPRSTPDPSDDPRCSASDEERETPVSQHLSHVRPTPASRIGVSH